MRVCNCVLPQMTGRMCAACEAEMRQQQQRNYLLPPLWWFEERVLAKRMPTIADIEEEWLFDAVFNREPDGEAMRPENV